MERKKKLAQNIIITNFFDTVGFELPSSGKPRYGVALHCSQSNAEDGSRHHVIGLQRKIFHPFLFPSVLLAARSHEAREVA